MTLIPCAVVVDSRNMRGQARKMFGWPRQASVQGVRLALAGYGLDATDIYFGVATKSASTRPQSRVESSLIVNRRYRDQLLQDGAKVLEGNLVERGERIEEKQVDVLCAVTVCDLADRILTGVHPAKSIVVLSEDMDLMPSHDFARNRGVTTYAAAFDTVHTRDGQRDWLLLDEAAIRHLVAPVGRYTGSDLRAKMAAIATSTDSPSSNRWTVHSPSGRPNQYLMRGNLGAAGLWYPGQRVDVGTKVDLFTVGVLIDPDGGRFPYFELADTARSQAIPDIQRAEVLYWQSPTSVRVAVRAADTQATLRAAPGSLLPGQEVAVLRAKIGGADATYLIGALSARPLIDGWSSPTGRGVAVVAEPEAWDSTAWLPGQLTGTGERVLIHAKFLAHATPGTSVSVCLVGAVAGRRLPAVMPLTCCTP